MTNDAIARKYLAGQIAKRTTLLGLEAFWCDVAERWQHDAETVAAYIKKKAKLKG